MTIDELVALEAKATPAEALTVTRYDLGGARAFVEGDLAGNGRQLVADFFDVPNRELFVALRNVAPELLALAQAVTRWEASAGLGVEEIRKAERALRLKMESLHG